MGKTLLLNTVAACQAAPPLSAEEDSGLIRGAALKQAYARVITVRLRDLNRLDAPFIRPGISVADAVAWAVAEQLGLLPVVSGANPAEFLADLFGSVDAPPPPTLWLLDGFDEAPGAEALASALTVHLTAAFREAREESLAAPSHARAEVSFLGQMSSSISSTGRLEAVLRILLMQPHVVVSSRPQFEDLLAPFTGRANARYARLELLLPEAVHGFVRGALKVCAERVVRWHSLPYV